MDSPTRKTFKKKSREGNAKSHDARVNKKKKKKESNIKLSNYEKAIRKFNLNQQLCAQSRIENRRITRGPLKVKPAQDGMFLKAKRSLFVRKMVLNDANEARKNEDINKIIDIANGLNRRDRDIGKKNEDKDILKRLNLPDIYIERENKLRERGALSVTESNVLCSQNHDDYKDNRRDNRNTRKKEVALRSSTKSSSDTSYGSKSESKKIRRNRFLTTGSSTSYNPGDNSGHEVKTSVSSFDIHPEDDLFQRTTNSEGGIYDDLIKTETSNITSLTFPYTSSRTSKPRKAKGERVKIGLEDFEEFTARFENALAKDECPMMNVPGIAETVLRSLKVLYRRRMKIYEDRKIRKGAHHVQGDELKSKKTNDPMLTWFFDAASRNKSQDSPRISLSMDAWNAKSDSNIFTFPYSETVEGIRESDGLSDFMKPVNLFLQEDETYLKNTFPDPDLFVSELSESNFLVE